MGFQTKNGIYKDIESVVVTTETLQATFLPSQGGKMASLINRETGREYLYQRPEGTYRKLGLDTSYVEAECAGYDDMFPTIDPWEVPDGEYKGKLYPDHGEVARVPHHLTIEEHAVYTSMTSRFLPYMFEKKISENARGGLRIDFKVINTSSVDLDYIWAAHFMAVAEEGGRVMAPLSDGAKAEVTFSSDERKYGARNDKVTLPYGIDGITRIDENKAFVPGKGDAWKYYFCNPFPEGWMAYVYPSDGSRLVFRFDPKQVPYGGIWLNDGSFQNHANAAMEIATGSFDRPDEARKRNQYSVLKAHMTDNWYFEIDIEK